MTYLISETALIAAEDAYDAIATEHFEQINRSGIEAAVKAYLATDPALAYAVEVLLSIAEAEDWKPPRGMARAALNRLRGAPS